jgi:hypothetical protein
MDDILYSLKTNDSSGQTPDELPSLFRRDDFPVVGAEPIDGERDCLCTPAFSKWTAGKGDWYDAIRHSQGPFLVVFRNALVLVTLSHSASCLNDNGTMPLRQWHFCL